MAVCVAVPPTTLTLSQLNDQDTYEAVDDGATLVFVEGSKSGVKCEVTVDGSIAPPTVLIKIGDTNVTGRYGSSYNKCAREIIRSVSKKNF